MKRRYALLAFCLALPMAATAQTVQKCQSPSGVRFQSAPCGRGERTVEVWDATPEPEAPPRAYAPSREPRPGTTRGRTVRRYSGRSARTASAVYARMPRGRTCEEARAYRDAMERRAGLSRNYDLLSALQGQVYDACQ